MDRKKSVRKLLTNQDCTWIETRFNPNIYLELYESNDTKKEFKIVYFRDIAGEHVYNEVDSDVRMECGFYEVLFSPFKEESFNQAFDGLKKYWDKEKIDLHKLNL